MEQKQELVQQRYVTIFSSRGHNGKNIPTSATTWKELQSDLGLAGVQYSGMKAVEGDSQLSFESPDAKLPAGNFRLFLLPVKTKSGGPSRDAIKGIIAEFGDKAKAHFNKEQNYTRKTEVELTKLLGSWNKKGLTAPSTPVVAKPVSKAKEAASKASAKISASKPEVKKNEEPKIDNNKLQRELDQLMNKIPGVDNRSY